MKAIFFKYCIRKERSNKGNLAACVIEAGIFLKHSLNRLQQEAKLSHNNSQLKSLHLANSFIIMKNCWLGECWFGGMSIKSVCAEGESLMPAANQMLSMHYFVWLHALLGVQEGRKGLIKLVLLQTAQNPPGLKNQVTPEANPMPLVTQAPCSEIYCSPWFLNHLLKRNVIKLSCPLSIYSKILGFYIQPVATIVRTASLQVDPGDLSGLQLNSRLQRSGPREKMASLKSELYNVTSTLLRLLTNLQEFPHLLLAILNSVHHVRHEVVT